MLSSLLLFIFISPFGTAAQRQRVSQDGSCAGPNSITCRGSTFGNCCSQYGFCGSSAAYCGNGCNPAFGTCSVAKSPATQQVSTDSRCGPSFGGRTCLGSQHGDCCSRYSYCGSSQDYCKVETCQKGYGKCGTFSSSIKPVSLPTSRSTSLKVSMSVSSSPTTTSPRKSSSTSLSSASRLNSSQSSGIASSSSSQSSTIKPSTSPRTSASASPEPSCFSVPSCTPVATSLFDCNASNDQCQAGFQAKCGQMPIAGSVVISKTPSNSGFNQACLQLCVGESRCVGFDNNAFPNSAGEIVWSCTLYSNIIGVSKGWGTSYLKVCNNATDGPSIGPSSTVAVPFSAISSSSATTSSSVAVSPSPAASPTPPTCSDLKSGDYYSNGKHFVLSCYAKSASEHLIGSELQPTFTSCLDACSQRSDCRIASYNVNPNDSSYHLCSYYQATTRGTGSTANYSTGTIVN